MKNETTTAPIEGRTEILNVPMPSQDIVDWDQVALAEPPPWLMSLAEQQFQATGPGPGFLHMEITSEGLRLFGGYGPVAQARPTHEAIGWEFRHTFTSLFKFCYQLSVVEFQGLDPEIPCPLRLRVTWQAEANWDAVKAARQTAARAELDRLRRAAKRQGHAAHDSVGAV